MAVTAGAGRYRYSLSRHLLGLIADAERLAGLISEAPADQRRELAARCRPAAARATLVLDGVSASAIPDAAAAEAALGSQGPEPAAVTTVAPGTWLDALRVGEPRSDARQRALELLGALAGLATHELTEGLASDPGLALRRLHRRLTRGLVPPEAAGLARTTDQAVVDAATGRVVYFACDPAAVPGELELLWQWLADARTSVHPLIISGVVHVELLRLQPFETANGRLARAAARALLHGGGLDPDGVAVPETGLARDPTGYHAEVASTARRRDVTIWTERWGEAVTDGLRAAARELSVLSTRVPARAEAFVAAPDRDRFTIADYTAETAAGPGEACADLDHLLDAGAITRVPGASGLRFETSHGPSPTSVTTP